MRKLTLLVLAVLLAGFAQAQSFSQVFGQTQVSATGYYNPAGADATRNGESDWLSRSSEGHYISGLYHLGQDMMVSTPTYTDGTPAGIGHSVYAIADGVVHYVSKGINGDGNSATPGFFNQTGYVSTSRANWGTTKCETIQSLTLYDPGCTTGTRKYNVSVVVKHKIANSSNYFLAIYGHMIDFNVVTGKPFQNGDVLAAGQAFAFVGDWVGTNGRHLHFGIFLPNSNTKYPSLPGKFGLANDTDCVVFDSATQQNKPCKVIDWPETFGLVDPIAWLTNTSNNPDNHITALGTQTTTGKTQISGAPATLSVPKGGVKEVSYNLQSLLGFIGTATPTNAVSTPSSILSLSPGQKVLAANETAPLKTLVYAPSTAPLATYPLKIQSVFQDSGSNLGVSTVANTSLQVVNPSSGGSGTAVELFQHSLYADSSLVAYYRLENTSDSKGSYTLTASGSPSSGSGKFANGYSYNGSYHRANSNLGINGGAVSISGWVKLNALPSSGSTWYMASQFNSSSKVEYDFWYTNNSGAYSLSVNRGKSGVSDNPVSTTINLGTSLYHHVVLTYDGTTLTGYLDGASFGTLATSGNGNGGSVNDFIIGAAYNGTSGGNVTWDDVAVFNRALTSSEVSSLYGTASSPNATLNLIRTSGGMTVAKSFTVYATADSVDPAQIQGVIYGTSCASGCIGTKVDATSTSYVGSFTPPSQTGTYQFKLRNGAGGTLSSSQNLTIYSALTASCSPSVSSTPINTPVTFTASASGGLSPYSFTWDNGAVGTGSPISVSYASGGRLAAVDLHVTDALGNQTRATCGVEVQLGQPAISSFGALGSPTAGIAFDGGLVGTNFGTNLEVWFCQSPSGTPCFQHPVAGVAVSNEEGASQSQLTGINLSAGTWFAKVRNGATGTWSNSSTTITVATGASSTEVFQSSLFSSANLLAYYRLENANDSKGSYNLTAVGSPAAVAAKFGNGYSYSGSSTYHRTNSNLGINGGAVSISGWIKLNALPSSGSTWYLASQFNSSAKVEYDFLYTNTSGTYTFSVNRGKSGVSDNAVSTATNLGTSSFHHVVLTYDGATLTGYLDGVSFGTLATSGNGNGGSANDFVLGAAYNGTSGANVIWDDVAIFNRALTATEVSSLYGGGSSSTTGSINVTVSGYSGNVSCTLNGTGITAPVSLTNKQAGSYSLSCTAPTGYTVSTISPSANQTLAAGSTIGFAVELTSTASPGFTFTTLNANKSVQAGNQVGYDLNITPSNNFTNSVTVSVTGLPSNTSIVNSSLTFSVGPTSGATFTLTLQTTGGTPAGTYQLTLTALGGGVSKTLYVNMTVTAPPPAALSVSCYLSPNPVTLGNGTTLFGNATGGSGGYTYSFNGGAYQSGSSSVVLPNNGGTFTYSVTAKDSSNATASTNCSVTVNGSAPTVTGTSWDTTPTHGVNFSGYISGSKFTPTSTVWFYGPGCSSGCQHPSAGVSVQSLTSIRVVNVNLAAGTWQVQVRTAYGTATSGNFTVN